MVVFISICISGVYLYFRSLMYVKRYEQFEIGCGAILNKIYYYYQSSIVLAFYLFIFIIILTQ